MQYDLHAELLGIALVECPPNHYRLLGLDVFETDAVKIHAAVLRRVAHLRKYALHSDPDRVRRVQELLNEVSRAGTVLESPEGKIAYDEALRKEMGIVGDRRPCPNCRATLSSDAAICPFCGLLLHSRQFLGATLEGGETNAAPAVSPLEDERAGPAESPSVEPSTYDLVGGDTVSPVRIRCDCGKTLSVSEDLLGRKVRCPGCGAVFLAQASDAVHGFASEDSASRYRTVPDAPMRQCHSCGALLQPNAVLCMECGFNQETGVRARSLVRNDASRARTNPGRGMPTRLLALVLAAAGAGFYFGYRGPSGPSVDKPAKPAEAAAVAAAPQPEPAAEPMAPAANWKRKTRRVKVAASGIFANRWKDIVYHTNSLDMQFVEAPAGSFRMGNNGEGGRQKFSRPFFLGAHEVTQAQWKAVMGSEPWSGTEGAGKSSNSAASNLSWNATQDFCRRLSEMEGIQYRLPTEAEWEYACRAGSGTKWHCGNSENRLMDCAWYKANTKDAGRDHVQDVGGKLPNAWGLYDMHGNVWEWCQSLYEPYPYAADDGRENLGVNGSRVLRGGSWASTASGCLSASRLNRGRQSVRDVNLGFRVVAVLSR